MSKLQTLFEERCNVVTNMYQHLPFLRQIVIDKNAKVVMEIGVHEGESTIAFLAGLEITGGKLFSCDLTEPWYPVSQVYKQVLWDHFSNGDKNYLEYALQQGLNGIVDILHIDTSHNYEDTKFELETYVPFLNETGIILMHDVDPETMYPDQMKAIYEWLSNNPEWIYTYHSGNNGMAVIYRNINHLNKI